MGCKVELMSVDFPLPETPVMQISIPSGKSTEISFRLFPEQPLSERTLPFPGRRTTGTLI